MVIGSFGELVFESSSIKVSTFTDFKRDTKANFAEHKIISNPPLLEYLHRELETITFSMIFHEKLGVEPAEECQILRDYCKQGTANYLIIGEHAFGENAWIVENISEAVQFWNAEAQIMASKVDVQLKEYAGEIDDYDDEQLD